MRTPADIEREGRNLTMRAGQASAALPERPRDDRRRTRWQILLSIAIPLVFTAWGLRTIGSYTVIETDAARHAMNGVFIHDLIARGKFTDVLPFAKTYYAHLPAL